MAKKKRGNKSQAIRDYLSANKDAKPRDVVAALKEQKISVSSQMVSTIKLKMGQKGAKRTTPNGEAISLNDLLQAKKLVDQFGIEKAKAAIATLAKLA